MHISAKSDYAIRAALALAVRHPAQVTGETLAAAQELPVKYLQAILGDLRRAGVVRSHRGAVGGFTLAQHPSQITVGQVLRAVDGPLADVRGLRPDQTSYIGAAAALPTVWIAARAALRSVLDEVTLTQIATNDLPAHILDLAGLPGARAAR